jgi:hypothetical protein
VAISLLLHILVFAFLLYYLAHGNKSVQPNSSPMVIQLQHLQPSSALVSNTKKIISVPALSPIKIPSPVQQPSDISADSVAPSAKVSSSEQTEKITGIAMPGKINSGFSGFQAEGNAFSQASHSQQDIARSNYQQMIEAQARLKSAQQSQNLLMQLQQTLRKRLDSKTAATGTCNLIGSETHAPHLKCDSVILYGQIRNDEQNLLGMFKLLRNMGNSYSGFKTERLEGNLHIFILN